jgi:hypothetical protein
MVAQASPGSDDMPIIRKANTINTDEPLEVPATANGDGPTLLAKAELDHIAAAGSKPGISGGSGATVDRPRPPLPK